MLGSSAAGERGLVLSFALGARGYVWLCVLWCWSGSERGHLVPVPAQIPAGLISGMRDAEGLWVGLILIWDLSLCCTRFTESIVSTCCKGTRHRISFPIISFVIYCPFPPFCLQGISNPLYLPGVQAVSQSQESSTSPFKVLGASSPGPVGCQVKCDLKHSTDELCQAS